MSEEKKLNGTVIVTYRCNARCSMCNRYKAPLGTVLFFIHALILAPIYLGLKRMKKSYPVYLGMLVFYLLFYNTSLNMMRQWIATFYKWRTELLLLKHYIITIHFKK